MAITQSQADKDWVDTPSTSTPIMAVDLENVSGMNRDHRWMSPTTNTTVIDEFDDDSIGGSWTQVNPTGAASGHVTWAEGGDSISVTHSTTADTGTAFHAILFPLSGVGGSVSAGDAFVTCITMFGKSAVTQAVAGVALADGTTAGSGNQVIGTMSYVNTVGFITITARPFTNFDTQGTTATTANYAINGPVFLRLVCVTSTTWRTDISPNGVSWILGNTCTKTITPTHAGLVVTNFGGAVDMAISWDYLRRVSGVS